MSDNAGYICAFVGALAHGSYGVPVKATKDVDVHPLILQSYKTAVLAFMSCVVIPLVTVWLEQGKEYDANNRLRFTPFGILSGFLWVTGGACGIYGIRKAGMAIAVGTWASLMVCVNFTWGILIFREPVHSFLESCMAFGLLLVGLVGMSKYSAKPSGDIKDETSKKSRPEDNGSEEEPLFNSTNSLEMEDGVRPASSSSSSNWGDVEMRNKSDGTSATNIGGSTRRLANRGPSNSSNVNYANGSSSNAIGEEESEDTSLAMGLFQKMNAVIYGDVDRHKKHANLNLIAIWYRFMALISTAFASLTPRQAGILMAATNGILGGCALVPLHYAKKEGFQGLTYIPSFGLGSFIANIVLWSLYFAWTYQQQRQQYHSQAPEKEVPRTSIWKSSVELMPSFYWAKLWKRGLLAGFLLSIGMICSILATGALGQGVGNSLVQLKILISGLWGIFYYKEIQNKRSIKFWFLSASICISGILGLTYQRLMATQDAAMSAAAALPLDIASLEVTVPPTEGMIITSPPLDSSAIMDTPVGDLPNFQVAEAALAAGNNN
ncbi:unnamed protein product [Cylindrotheca closterium]|uniref:Uncharacterized protein n=1 Tax=Cylindrotheca closterium TaxID=2856 RepID=A0AAD2FNF3_9STRA|nr:unnamed protein product [Cylindrotheca closterium]